MLKNRFRKLTGIIILVVFLVAVGRWGYQFWGNEHVLGALLSGLTLLAVLGGILFGMYQLDKRMKKRESE